MISVSGKNITMTRGDTCRIKINLTDENSQEYTPVEGDVVRFAAKANYTDPHPLILITIPNDTLLLEIKPEDTKNLAFGNYVYDIQITLADGTVNTFITKGRLKIEEEVY